MPAMTPSAVRAMMLSLLVFIVVSRIVDIACTPTFAACHEKPQRLERLVMRGRSTIQGDGRRLVTTRDERRRKLESEVRLLEGVLDTLFEDDDAPRDPNIYKVREVLARLARIQRKPNAKVSGDFMIEWASRRDAVHDIWWTDSYGELDRLREFVIRLGTKREGQTVKAAEVVDQFGPFPSTGKIMLGKYATGGPTSLRIVFDRFEDFQGNNIELGKDQKKRILDFEVIYSGKKYIAMQCKSESTGEADFFVLKAVDNFEDALEEFLGQKRRRFFFN